jgi:hypothetical protein
MDRAGCIGNAGHIPSCQSGRVRKSGKLGAVRAIAVIRKFVKIGISGRR